MRKLFLLLLAAVMVFSLAACGEDNSGNNTPSGGDSTTAPPTQTEGVASAPTESAPEVSAPATSESDEGSVAGFLALYGLIEDDIKPDHFVEFGELDMDGKTKAGEIGSMGGFKMTVDKDATGDEQVRTWYEQLYTKLQGLSVDGKLHTDLALEKEATLEALFENPLWEKFPGTLWLYRYNAGGKNLKLTVSTKYDYETGVYSMSIGVMPG